VGIVASYLSVGVMLSGMAERAVQQCLADALSSYVLVARMRVHAQL
jgi:hypothetical protein